MQNFRDDRESPVPPSRVGLELECCSPNFSEQQIRDRPVWLRSPSDVLVSRAERFSRRNGPWIFIFSDMTESGDSLMISVLRSLSQRCHARAHSDERPYTCTECAAAFRTSSNLVIHERRHRGEKPYSCPECTMLFYSGTNLAVHKRTHTGEKPFICEWCDRCFTQQSGLSDHRRVYNRQRTFRGRSGTRVRMKPF